MKAQTERLLAHLEAGKPIDGIKAWELLGIYRLSARIWDLREDGYDIEDVTIRGKNRFGEHVHYKKYFMANIGTGYV